MTNMHKDSEVQQRTEESDHDHWSPNRVGMKSDHRCSHTRAKDQRPYSNRKAKTIDSHDGSANALKQCKEETGPGDHASVAHQLVRQDWGDGLARFERS